MLRLPRLSFAATLALLVGFGGTAYLYSTARGFEQQKAAIEFEERANLRVTAVRQGLQEAVDGLQTINHLFSAVDPLTREQFRQFAQPLLERYPYVQAYEFHRVVESSALPAYVAQMRRQYATFTVTQMEEGRLVPARPQPRYSIVDYVEPMAGNEAAFGLDVARNSQMNQVLLRAVDSGVPAATGMLQLIQAAGARKGFLVMMPVYRNGQTLDSIEARRAAVIGDTSAVFQGSHLVEKILTASGLLNADPLNLSVYASDTPLESNLIFRHEQARPDNGVLEPVQRLLGSEKFSLSRSVDVAGINWRMVLSDQPRWMAQNNGGSLMTLLFGSLLTLLGAAYLQAVSSRARAIQELVERRTAELKQANALLTEDIVARARADQALRLRERVIESSANAILIIQASAPDFPIEYVNPAFVRITGYSAAEVIGKEFRIIRTDHRDQLSLDEVKAALRDQRDAHVTIRSARKDGSVFWNDVYIAPVKDRSGLVTHFVVTTYDVTSTKHYQAELEFQANRDTLTGLANRNLLRDRLRQAIAYADRYGHPLWVVFIDLDRFKIVNESLGHKAGDSLLQQVGQRMLTGLLDAETIARTGGDEFVLILPQSADKTLSVAAVQRVMDALKEPFTIEGHEFFLTASIGVATFPNDGIDADTLIKHAEIAMYRAKEIGRNNFQFYTPKMNQEALERLRLEGNLRTAIDSQQFVLHYQPQVDLASGRIVGMEALIRWHHPELGMIPPARFIGLAEESGLIVPIGEWVTRTACLQAKAWQDAGFGGLTMSVNLSVRQFYQHDLVESIASILQQTGLAPSDLEIELTESLVMTDVERAITVLAGLKSLGVKISIDDFGTGYSSLSYLKRFPIDVLKIDQSFVRDIAVDADDAAIVAAVISLAHSLRLKVIAEGVETHEQLCYLRDNGCDQVQGYFISRPLPAVAFAMILDRSVDAVLQA